MTAFWVELPGLDARIVEKAIDQRADEIISGDVRLAVAERRALALVAICQDSLYDPANESESSPVEVVVTVDARTATPTQGEAGVSVLAGPRIGPRSLEEILCNGVTEVVGIADDGEPLFLGRRAHVRVVGEQCLLDPEIGNPPPPGSGRRTPSGCLGGLGQSRDDLTYLVPGGHGQEPQSIRGTRRFDRVRKEDVWLVI